MKTKLIALVAVVAFGVIVAGGYLSSAFVNQTDHAACEVLSKERLIRDGSSGEKRVGTTCGTFAVEDSLAGGFNSLDTFNSLREGETVDIRTGGFRVGFLSIFPTVIEATPVG